MQLTFSQKIQILSAMTELKCICLVHSGWGNGVQVWTVGVVQDCFVEEGIEPAGKAFSLQVTSQPSSMVMSFA